MNQTSHKPDYDTIQQKQPQKQANQGITIYFLSNKQCPSQLNNQLPVDEFIRFKYA